VVAAVGLDPADLGERIAAPAIKDALRALTADAVARGVFGVPTFALGEELFWGHDRLDHVADRLSGRLPDPAPLARTLLARPFGVDRRQGASRSRTSGGAG
jgi:predicted DsbA family dithiol-disulfide isomerase